jgi:AraC-like DNA-binding protein
MEWTSPKHRLVFSSPRTLVPDLATIGWDRYRQTTTSLMGHRHNDAWELCLIVRGTAEWWAGHRVFHLVGGDAYLTQPEEPHGGVDGRMHPCELMWLQVRNPPGRAFVGLSHSESKRLRAALRAVGTQRLVSAAALPLFRRLLDLHRTPHSLARLDARNTLHRLLLDIIEVGRAPENSARRMPQSAHDACQLLGQNLEALLSITDVAEQLGYSVARFHDVFREATGLPPHTFRLKCRLSAAKRMLDSTTLSCTEIAARCGFGTSQHFATTFRRHVGLSPRQYRAAHNPEKIDEGKDIRRKDIALLNRV